MNPKTRHIFDIYWDYIKSILPQHESYQKIIRETIIEMVEELEG